MDHRPQAWGRPRDDVYGAYDHSYLQNSGPKNATQSPVVTGTSVIALKFKGGVVMAADNLASYGSLARFTDVPRLRPFAGTSILGFGGDVSDMQYLDRHLTDLAVEEAYGNPHDSADPASPSNTLNAANLHKYLSKLLYARRNKFDPLWNQILVAGSDEHGDPFLASVDLRGTVFAGPSLATGFGAALAQPILRRAIAAKAGADAKKGPGGEDGGGSNLSREEAIEAIKECMKVLYYRDARSMDRYSLAVVTKEGGVELKEDEVLEKQSWAFAERIKGYGTQTV